MDTIAKLHNRYQPLHLSLNPNRPSFPKPIYSLSFRTPPPPQPLSSSPFKSFSIKASSSSQPLSSCNPLYQAPKPSLLQTLSPLLKTTFITLTTAAALFFTRLHINRPAIAAPIATSAPASTTMDPTTKHSSSPSSKNDNVSLEEQERALEEHLTQNPNDAAALRSLMEVRIKSQKLLEAIEAVDRLIELEPTDDEWPLLKGQIYSFSGDFESARKIFEEILEKDPIRVEAYHGLVMANSESGNSFNGLLKRIQLAMDKCKKEKKNSDLRDFKLLLAQVQVIEEKYVDALNLYEELVKEEPRDFRPYLCQGIIYTLLRKKDEAEKKFEQFRKLVPPNHPYKEYLFDNMFATKFLSEKVERESTGPGVGVRS